MKRYGAPFVAVLLTCLLATAQAQVQTISLNELLSHADTASTTLKTARSGIAAGQQELEATRKGTLLPDVRLNASVGYLGNGYGWGRDSSYRFTVPMPHFSTRFGIDARQIIYAGGAPRTSRQQAALGLHLQELAYEQGRQDIRLQLTGLYMDLYRAVLQLQVYDSNIALTKRLIADVQVRQRQGTALRNDLTRYELQLSNLRMQRTRVENDIAILRDQITTTANLPPHLLIEPDSSFLHSVHSLEHSTPLSVQTAEARAEMAGLERTKSHAAMLPYVAIVAQDQLSGPVTIDITPYNINYNYWFVGIAVNYNLSSLWKEHHTVQSLLKKEEQTRLELQTAEQHTKQATQAAILRHNEAVLNLSSKRKNMELAAQNYTLVADRYHNDLALLVDMLDAANTKLSAELDLISARSEVVYSSFVIDYLHGAL